MTTDNFNFDGAITVPVNDGLIKCILVERSECEDVSVEDNSLSLPTASNAIIEFENGKKMLITNSEWCSLNWLK